MEILSSLNLGLYNLSFLQFLQWYRYYKNHQKGRLVDFQKLPLKREISEKSTEPRIRSLGNHKFLIFPLDATQGIF